MRGNVSAVDVYRRDHGPKITDRFRDLQHVTVQFDYPGTTCALWQELDKEIYCGRRSSYAVVLHVVRIRHKLADPFGPPTVVMTKWRKYGGLWSRLSLISLWPEAVTVFRAFLDRTFEFEGVDMCPRCGRTEHEEQANGKKHCKTCDLDWPRDETEATDAA